MTIRCVALLVVLAAVQAAHADPPPPPGDDPIGDRVFPPDLIMSHQAELGLDPGKRQQMLAEIERFQTAAVKIQWDLKQAGDALAGLLAAPAVDEARALAQADKVMALEHDLKRAHLQLLVELKNELTPAQQERLRALRARHP